MSELNQDILNFLDKNASLDTLDYAKQNNLDHQKVVGAVKSLQTYEGVSDRLRLNTSAFFVLKQLKGRFIIRI